MSTLPLIQKLPEGNLFRMLNLPLSTKWPQVKKAYESRMKDLEGQVNRLAPDVDNAAIQQERSQLQQAYTAFSARLSEKNRELYQTREALKTLDLPDSSDWDAVNDRFDTLRRQGQEQDYVQAYQQLETKKHLITRDKRTDKTWAGAAVALGALGISLAAYHTLNADESAELMAATPPPPGAALQDDGTFQAAGAVAPPIPEDTADNMSALGVDALETDRLNQYIEENYSVEQEMLSMIGMAPDQVLSLTLQRKMEVFVSMIKGV